MIPWIPVDADLDNAIYWKIDIVSSHARRLEGSAHFLLPIGLPIELPIELAIELPIGSRC